MKIVNQKAIIMDQTTVSEAYKHIEKIGRTCYKSEDRITDDSAVKFCVAMKNSKHYGILEHYTIHMIMTEFICDVLTSYMKDYGLIKYIAYDYLSDGRAIVSASFRPFLELADMLSQHVSIPLYPVYNILKNTFPEIFVDVYTEDVKRYDDEIIICSDDVFVEKMSHDDYAEFSIFNQILMKHMTHTFLFTTDRGISHELVRHRPASFAQESTRYCNYSKGKFGNEITVIKPCFYEEGSELYELWKKGCEDDEINYFKLLDKGATAQQARDNLPTSLKTDIIVTATEEEWRHIIDLRYKGITGAPHPQMIELMGLAYPFLANAVYAPEFLK